MSFETPEDMLIDDNRKMMQAGCNLASAAIKVTTEYDGVYRLRLAIAEWAKTIADESGRGERYGKKILYNLE